MPTPNTPEPTHHLSASYAAVDVSHRLDQPATSRLQGVQLVALTQRISSAPGDAMVALVELAMKATGAHAAGLSMSQRQANGEEIFRWVATCGELAYAEGGTMPRWFSPCGDVVRRNSVTLMREPIRHYPYIATLKVRIHEALLAPFRLDGEPQGTVWVLSQDPDKTFDAADGRTLQELADFVSTSTLLLQRITFGSGQ